MRIRFVSLLFILVTPILFACEQEPVTPSTQAPAKAVEPSPSFNLLNEPGKLERFESTAEAMTVWRNFRDESPTLLLLSNNPHLKPVPKQLRKAALILANNATIENIRLAATDRNPGPLFLPGMAIDAALRSNWFREMVWALPLRDAAQDLSLEKFQTQFSRAGFATEEEVQGLTLNERILSGSLRGVPFRAAALPLVKGLDGPVIVHLDLSYFQPLYKNEIATPLFDIIQQTLGTLKKMHLNIVAATFSYGHHDSQIALDVRFIGDIINYLVEDPARMEQDIPQNWQLQRDTLYLANFFQKDKIRELYLAQEKASPNEAYIKFNLYRSAAEHKDGNKALDYLAEAVILDPIYALEYLEFSGMAYEKGRPDEALRMLKLASDNFHQDPFIKLQMIQLANELGQKDYALELLNKLRNLNWSEVYYPDMPQYIADLTTFVQSGEVPEQQDKTERLKQKGLEMVTPGINNDGNNRQKTLHRDSTK